MKPIRITALWLLPLIMSGCYLRPNFGPPGTIGMQRSRAVLHDPFPSNELGPPILGGRPLGFDLPQPETQNLQEVRGALFTSSTTQTPAAAFPQFAPQQQIQPPQQQFVPSQPSLQFGQPQPFAPVQQQQFSPQSFREQQFSQPQQFNFSGG